jgi:hypothetical protein
MENMQPLAIQLCFDQVDGFIFSGIKEVSPRFRSKKLMIV